MPASDRLTRRWIVLALVMSICQAEWMDMTHILDDNGLFWPDGQKDFHLNIREFTRYPEGYWYQSDEFETGIHGGTHMDAPCHFYKDAWCMHEVPADHFIAPGVFVDIRESVAKDPDSNLTLADVRAWEETYGRIPEKAVIIQCSGWSDRYPNKTLVFGNDRGDVANFHFPGFDVEAVDWLIEERGIVGIGVDTPSFDYAPSVLYPVHVLLGAKNVFGLEYVKGTCDVPPRGTTVYTYPMRIRGASGAPARVVAYWDTNPSGTVTIEASLVQVVLLCLAAFIFQ